MKAVRREDVPVAIEGDGVEFRRQEIGGDPGRCDTFAAGAL